MHRRLHRPIPGENSASVGSTSGKNRAGALCRGAPVRLHRARMNSQPESHSRSGERPAAPPPRCLGAPAPVIGSGPMRNALTAALAALLFLLVGPAAAQAQIVRTPHVEAELAPGSAQTLPFHMLNWTTI